MHDPLRNPYWSALCTGQAPIALGNNLARRFPADVIPFAGVASTEKKALAALHTMLGPSESIYITSDEPCSHPRLEQTKDMPGIQMVCTPEAQRSTTDADVTGARWSSVSTLPTDPRCLR